MESIYYVMSWLCHRRCVHCYDGRFRPYRGAELERVVREARDNHRRIIDHLPERMTYRDLADPLEGGGYREKTGRVIVSGGEALVEPIRESVLYSTVEALVARYRGAGGVKVVVQTTGDLVTERIVDDLLRRGVWMISCAGMDDFHVGIRGERRERLIDTLTRIFEGAGMRRSGQRKDLVSPHDEDGPLYNFFGATPEAWIGKLWPRGRAWENDLSTATLQDNFCNRWSGGLNFLQHGYSGSEVAIEPDGSVYPCCMKTKLPLGNLVEERLIDILDSLVGDPVFEAISMGHPERMGISHGWDVDRFFAESATATPAGRAYRNLCIGCDRFHAEVLAPTVEARRRERLARRQAAAAA